MSWIRSSAHLISSRRATLSRTFSLFSAWLIENSQEPAARITIALFIAFVLPTSLSLALLVPPGEMADEPAHIARAASLLRGEVIAKPSTVTVDGKQVRIGGVICNTALLQAESSFPGIPWPKPKKMTRQNLERLQAIPWAKAASFVWAPNTAVYFPVFYIPVAIAIGVTKDLHFSPYTAILSARVVNALCFLLIGSLALLIARRGRPLLFAVLALPMTIALAASCNEDGLLIATFVLAAALLTRAEGPRGWPYMLGGMLLALVITVKIPYLPLAALMLIPLLGNSAGGQKRSWITGLRACFLVIAPGLLWAALNGALFTGPIVTRAPYHPGPFWPGDPATTFTAPHADAQLQVLAHHPQLLILLPFRDIQRYFADLVIWDSVIGRLAWMDVVLPRVMYTCWWIALAAAILSEALDIRTRLNRQWQIATIGLFAMIGGFVTLCASEYLAWTNVGAYFVDGIQGRYLIPLLASIALFVPALRMRHGRVIGAVLACPVFIMAAVGMVFLPILIVRTYYLTG